jgi:poly-gamma-glutamate synthesis protein (capsule biosynthesis protein)
MSGGTVTLTLCGDVMLGRGVDQILPHPGDPELREPWMRDARDYVALAETVNGPVPRPVDFAWPWGDHPARVRLLNLETSVTADGSFARSKGVHYRMHPANLPCLTAARPDVCVLANNHVLDFGRSGLADTLDALAGAGLRTAGAGRDATAAARPACVPLPGGHGRMLVFARATSSSGVPGSWAAGDDRPGVRLVPEPTPQAAARLTARTRRERRPGDLVVVSLHWGSNWGYEIPEAQTHFAHALIDGGVDVVHGHSSHHPRPVELYRGRPVLYGCGDFVNDYEGIGGNEEYRDDLRLLYEVTLDPAAPDEPATVRMLPFRSRRMRLEAASSTDAAWLASTLTAACRPFGTGVARGPDDALRLVPAPVSRGRRGRGRSG